MTLEDFFTLSELKDGLTAPERVNELITIMQKEKDTVVKNFGEATRQWSAVASTIAATENKNCLDLFIDLDGLCFIDRWLNDVQNLGDDTTNSYLEESIIALLRAVERLQIDSQRSLSSGIGRTVQNLLVHSSSVVRHKAKTLCDVWMVVHDNNAAPQDVNNISPSLGNDDEENNAARSRDETMSLGSVDAIQVKEITTPDKVMDKVTANQETIDSSCKITYDDINHLVKSEISDSKLKAHGSTPTVQGNTWVANKHVKDENEIDCQDKTELVEKSTLSSPLGQVASSADVNNVLESSMKTDLRVNKDEDMVDDGASPDHFWSATMFSTRNQVGVSASKWGEAESPKSSSSSESDREADDAKEDGIQSSKSLRNGSPFFKLSSSACGDGLKSKVSDMELDYGMIDPLEVARQVAIEVEREVDSRERSCSTSEKISGGGIERPSTPDSTNRKESPPVGGSDKEVSSEPKPSPKLLPSATEPVKDAETIVSERASCKPDITVSQISEVAQESEANTGRGFSGFDLNQEVCSEEVDNPINPVSSTISVVSASRAAVATCSPAAPLEFEGTLGWKGSASTSAFRRIHNNSKQRLDFLDIDLNVAEDSEDKIDDLARNKIPIISSVPSGEESSVEASPMRPERPQLDLNSIGDDGVDVVGFDWRRDGRVASVNRNGWQSPSRSSSSSSKQPTVRKFDLNLNDQLVFPNGASLDHPYVSKLSKQSGICGGEVKQQQSVIKIFGKKVEVQSKDSLKQPSGRIMPTMDFNLGRTGSGLGLGSPMHYGNPSLYGHNGFASGPPMFFTTPMYGSAGVPIPYMVDPRGAPVVPQMMGSSSTPPLAIAQPASPFVMNMAAAGTSSGSSGLDLNTGLMYDGGNRGAIRGLQQLFPQASSSSNVGEKRHEPDGGWEFFPVNKHQQPPWR